MSYLFLCFRHIKDVDDRQLLEKYELPGVHERCLTESLLVKLKQESIVSHSVGFSNGFCRPVQTSIDFLQI